MNFDYLIIILLITIILPLLFSYLIYLFAYRVSSYGFVKKRMNRRKTIALLLIEQNGEVLFRKKKGLHIGREEYKDTWVLPGGEVDLDEKIRESLSFSHTEIPLHMWALAYTQSQIKIKVRCQEKYITQPFSAPYIGGIRMGYPPGKIVIYCGEIVKEDENTKNTIQKILNNEDADKKFFSVAETKNISELFHPFYNIRLESILALRAKIEREINEKKILNNNLTEKLKKHIQKDINLQNE